MNASEPRTRLEASLVQARIDHYVEERPDGYLVLAVGNPQRLALQALCEDILPPAARQERGVDTTRFVLTATEAEALAGHVAAVGGQR